MSETQEDLRIKAPAASTSIESDPPPQPDLPSLPRLKDPKWSRREILVFVLIIIAAFNVRFIRLSHPNDLVFDETYYAKDACLYLGYEKSSCLLEQDTEQSYVHPQLGKWLIALGIKGFGYNSFGWRFSAVIFGTGLVALSYLLGRKLFRDIWIAAVAGVLVASDFLLIVQSRTSMLDIFLAFFVVLGFLFLAMDRERLLLLKEYKELGTGKPPQREYEWRYAAGAAFGLAMAVKWSAAWAIVGAFSVTVAWSIARMRWDRETRNDEDSHETDDVDADPADGKPAPKSRRELISAIVGLAMIPLLVYLSTYSLYYFDRLDDECSFVVPSDPGGLKFGRKPGTCVEGVGGTVLSFVDLHKRMASYHLELTAKHGYQSKAYTWPIVKRPVAYYYPANRAKSEHILAFGNPATWWAALIAGAWLIVRASKSWRGERVVLLGWGSQYLPWLFVARPLFFFYMTPVVPFMMIGLAAALGRFRQLGSWARVLVIAYLVLGVGILLTLFYPILTAVPLPYQWWRWRMWSRSWI